ncbi:MAG TPA: FliM/FliN family flagellar motor switch protein [Aliiroseovarius sp.]|nr:FliM/FliN family flagellar motor switch protein [Aliiroseovarius sp.]
MDETPAKAGSDDLPSPFSDLPVEVTVSVGKARPMVRELLQFKRNAVLPLDRRVDDLVELYIGDKLIARGELEEVADDPTGQLAVRLTEVAELDPGA